MYLLMPEMMKHIYNQDRFFNHRVQLIKIIIKKYIQLQLRYYAKKTIEPNRIRNKWTEVIFFRNQ